MVKKIKKYVKFVVCCALMLSLIAPSYAALSASDGSAFVTKAEFDSALADFNARLTTFEAGINSKIDSQVTSYLDRNGIWSGKEQINNRLLLATATQANLETLMCKNVANELWADMVGGDYVNLGNCVKSGLAIFTIITEDVMDAYYNGFSGSRDEGGCGSVDFVVLQNNVSISYTSIGQFLPNNFCWGSANECSQHNLMIFAGVKNGMVFVDKGVPLKVGLMVNFTFKWGTTNHNVNSEKKYGSVFLDKFDIY